MAELLREAINRNTVIDLGNRISGVYSDFRKKDFEENLLPRLGTLGLTERVKLISSTLGVFLPGDYPRAAGILVESLGEELDDTGDDPIATDYSSSRGFIVMALCTYIAENGKDDFDISMSALYEMTKRFSSEGPIRDFIVSDEDKVLTLYRKWVRDSNVHVRRLVSESLRPRLPWARQLPRFIKNPTPVLDLLARLKDDTRLYVRRSVANNLNDISKDHPTLVIETLVEWKRENDTPELQWLTKHALRTLIKQGNPGALALLGIRPGFTGDLVLFELSNSDILFGDHLELKLELANPDMEPQDLMVDYVVYHMKANGKLTPKVFKWTRKLIPPEGTLSLGKKHPIKEISTRRYYPGRHEVHLQINGVIVAKRSFELHI